VVVGSDVAMVMVVEGLEAQKVGCSLGGHDRSPTKPIDGSCVVIEQGVGGFCDVMGCCQYHLVGNGTY